MKLLICTKNDLYGAVILNYMLPRLQQHEIRVLLSDKVQTGANTINELRAGNFLEREFPLGHLFASIDNAHPTGQLLTFASLASTFAVSIQKEYAINGDQSTRQLLTWAPDLIVSARFSLIFKPHILSIPQHGAYNIHPGVLPGYAGVMAPLRAIWNNEQQLGCTVHLLDKGIDTGPVYSVSHTPVSPARAVLSYIPELYMLGINSFLDLVKTIERGKIPLVNPQDFSAFRYFRPPTEEEFSAKRETNIRYYDLSDYAKLLCQFLPHNASSETRSLLDETNLKSLLSTHLKRGSEGTPAA